jgi:hypothetical protein
MRLIIVGSRADRKSRDACDKFVLQGFPLLRHHVKTGLPPPCGIEK